jgi:hypothetical protein
VLIDSQSIVLFGFSLLTYPPNSSEPICCIQGSNAQTSLAAGRSARGSATSPSRRLARRRYGAARGGLSNRADLQTSPPTLEEAVPRRRTSTLSYCPYEFAVHLLMLLSDAADADARTDHRRTSPPGPTPKSILRRRKIAAAVGRGREKGGCQESAALLLRDRGGEEERNRGGAGAERRTRAKVPGRASDYVSRRRRRLRWPSKSIQARKAAFPAAAQGASAHGSILPPWEQNVGRAKPLGRASASGHVTVGVGASAVWIGSKLCTGPFYTGPDVHA